MTMTEHKNWQWWYSDNEERWQGPCEFREEAIEMGRDEYDGEPFMVMEACQGNFHLHFDHGDISDHFENANYDNSDPDGDSVLESIATNKQQEALISSLNIAIDHWIVEHNISTAAWAFKDQRNQETITP